MPVIRLPLVSALIPLATWWCLPVPVVEAGVFFVAPAGNDAAAGSADAPFATLERARQAARGARQQSPAEPVEVVLRGGTWRLDKPLILDKGDSGVVWRAAKGETPVLSGGKNVTGWKVVETNCRMLWQAALDPAMFPAGPRDLYLNGERRQRARSAPLVPAGMLRDGEGKPQGILLKDPAVAGFARPQEMQVRQQVVWRHYLLTVAAAENGPAGGTALRLRDTPEWLEPTFVGFKSCAPVVLENARELLDEPGEWYFDRGAGILFYQPQANESPDQVTAVVPMLERLLEIRGANDLAFEGIVFAEAAWHSPSDEGWFGYDPGFIIRGKGISGGFSFANVYATEAKRLRFHRNVFTRLGGIGLHLQQVSESEVIGNVFDDISADGLALGAVKDPGPEAPADLTASNNLFGRIGRDYPMGAAIVTGKLLNYRIHHNHIRDVPYIGILVHKLFGDPPLRHGQASVRWNRVDETMKSTSDGGAFYTWMDGSSDGTASVCSDNWFRDILAKDSQGIYLDNDCRHWTVERNVIEGARDRWYLIKGSHHNLRDNFTDTPDSRRQDLHQTDQITEEGTVVDRKADWQAHPAAKATIENAGLEATYRDLLARIPANTARNTPPVATITAAPSIGLLEDLALHGTVRDDGLPHGVRRFEWSKAAGPGEFTFFGQQTRALAVEAAFSLPGNYVLRLTATDLEQSASAEVKVNVTEADKGTDLAAGLPDANWTASATNSPGEAPAKAHDGDPRSFWYPGFPGVGWLQVDLGREQAVRRIEMTLRPDPDHKESRAEFEVVASNDPAFSSYVTVAQQGLDSDPQGGGTWSANLLPGSGKYRYVRFWKHRGFDGVVSELRVFGP